MRVRAISPPEREQACQHRVLVTREGCAVGALLCVAEQAAEPLGVLPVRHRERLAGKLHDDIDFALDARERRVDLARRLHRRRKRERRCIRK